MDVVLIRHRHKLMKQYLGVSPKRRRNAEALLRELGLEYWSDGELLAPNDPERKMT